MYGIQKAVDLIMMRCPLRFRHVIRQALADMLRVDDASWQAERYLRDVALLTAADLILQRHLASVLYCVLSTGKRGLFHPQIRPRAQPGFSASHPHTKCSRIAHSECTSLIHPACRVRRTPCLPCLPVHQYWHPSACQLCMA